MKVNICPPYLVIQTQTDGEKIHVMFLSLVYTVNYITVQIYDSISVNIQFLNSPP